MQAMFGNEGTKISVWPAIYPRLIRRTIAALCFLAANQYTRRLIASVNYFKKKHSLHEKNKDK